MRLSASVLGRQFDANSLVCGFLGEYGWQCSAQGANTTPPYFHSEPTGALDVNQDGSATGYFARYFVAPTAVPVSSVRFELDYALPAGASPASIYLQIFASNQSTLLAQVQVTPTSTWQTAITPVLAVTPGATYWLRVYVIGARALLGRARVEPLASTDAFWRDGFVRYQIAPGDMADNSSFGGLGLASNLIDNQHAYYDPDSSFSFSTDASRILVEVYNNQALFNSGWVDILVNGTKYTKIRAASPTYDVLSCSLPSGEKTVTLVTGAQIWNGSDLSGVAGSWPRAVYLPSSASFEPITPRVHDDTVVIYGNSKLAGYYAGFTGSGQDDNADYSAYGIPAFLRSSMTTGRVVNKAIGSRSLAKDYAAATNSVIDLARHVLMANPSHIIWEAARNDWGGAGATAPWASVAAWSTQFKALIDFCNTHSPATQQWLVYTTHESSEAANASGQTLANFWSELDVIFTDRQTGGAAPYKVPPKKLDLRGLWSSGQAGANTTYCTDGVHPSAFGYGLIGKAVRTALGR